MTEMNLGANVVDMFVRIASDVNMFEIHYLGDFICDEEGNKRDVCFANDIMLLDYVRSTTALSNWVALAVKHVIADFINFSDIKYCEKEVEKVDFLNYFGSYFWEKT
jgi:hypothetical protein